MYAERSSPIHHAVVWTATDPSESAQLVIPDGCIDLLWHAGNLLVAGPDTHAHTTTWSADSWTGLRLRCGIGQHIIGVPAHEIRDQRVLFAELLSAREARRFHTIVAASTDAGTALEHIARERLIDPPDTFGEVVFTMLQQGTQVSGLAAALGLSTRQLHRRCRDTFGYGPKTLGKILRFNRALSLSRSAHSLGDAAAQSGYADQAHLARDARSLTGRTVTSLLA